MKLVIVIPIYQERNIIEDFSLTSLYTNLSDWTKENSEICFLSHEENDEMIKEYILECQKYNIEAFGSYFDKSYFESTASYSQLLKSYDFYSRFVDYEYMLIYQTDVYMNYDDLKKWIDCGYDYIGAPIIAPGTSGWKSAPIVGNGGCSLRKLSWFLDVTNPSGRFQQRFKEELENSISARGEGGYRDYEDLYFAELCAYYYGISRPIVSEALSFAWDMNPDICHVYTNGTYPGMLHAFDKNLRWYRLNIDKLNNDELFKYCEEKYKSIHEYYMTDLENPSSFVGK